MFALTTTSCGRNRSLHRAILYSQSEEYAKSHSHHFVAVLPPSQIWQMNQFLLNASRILDLNCVISDPSGLSPMFLFCRKAPPLAQGPSSLISVWDPYRFPVTSTSRNATRSWWIIWYSSDVKRGASPLFCLYHSPLQHITAVRPEVPNFCRCLFLANRSGAILHCTKRVVSNDH